MESHQFCNTNHDLKKKFLYMFGVIYKPCGQPRGEGGHYDLARAKIILGFLVYKLHNENRNAKQSDFF